MRNIQEIRAIFNNWNNQILNSLSGSFTANDYLKEFSKENPDGYNLCVDNAGSPRAFNSWFARWFLIGLENQGIIQRTGEIKRIISVNNHISRNVEWIRIV